MSSYFLFYWLEACAQAGLKQESLDRIRSVWGEMLRRGATSTFENITVDQATPADSISGYGPDWHKIGNNYGQSWSHSWSSAPTSWLPRHVLGVQPATPGFATVEIRPFLGDLSWAEGSVPTPRGVVALRHETNREGITSRITLPRDTEAIIIPPPGLIIDSIDGKPPENRAKAVFRSTEPVIIHFKPAEAARKKR
jgi:hypothetical protein